MSGVSIVEDQVVNAVGESFAQHAVSNGVEAMLAVTGRQCIGFSGYLYFVRRQNHRRALKLVDRLSRTISSSVCNHIAALLP